MTDINDNPQTSSPDGTCRVRGPALLKNLLTSRMLANVPRAITASLPRREPYELNSRGVNLEKHLNIFYNESTMTGYCLLFLQIILLSIFDVTQDYSIQAHNYNLKLN